KRQIIWPWRFLGGRFRRSRPNREARMKNRKDSVAAQGPPKQRGDQIVSSPAPEKNKNDSASERNEKVAFGVKQSEAEQADLREKDVTEKKRWAETQRLVTQETKSPGESRERERDGGHADVEDGDVTEERGGIIDAGRE